MLTGTGTLLDEDQAALRRAAAGNQVLCTIVGLDGSFSRRLGAQLAIDPASGSVVGSMADGCLERELATRAAVLHRKGRDEIQRYGKGSPIIDFRLPCGSGVDILFDPRPDAGALAGAVARLDRRLPAQIALPVDRPDLLQSRAYIPTLRILAFGVGPELAELERLGRAYGIEIVGAGPASGLVLGQPPVDQPVDPWTAIVMLFHDHDWERAIVRWALSTPAFYVGAIGGAQVRRSRRAWLQDEGVEAESADRLISPVGLIPAARDPRTLALSVLAEIVSHYEKLRPEPGAGLASAA